MDRIELDEQLELEAYEKKQIKPLDLSRFAPESRFKVKKVSNPSHERNRLLATDISQAWGIPIPRIMRLFKTERYKDRYDYEQIFDAFEQTKKTEDCYRPWGLFLWKLKNAKSK